MIHLGNSTSPPPIGDSPTSDWFVSGKHTPFSEGHQSPVTFVFLCWIQPTQKRNMLSWSENAGSKKKLFHPQFAWIYMDLVWKWWGKVESTQWNSPFCLLNLQLVVKSLNLLVTRAPPTGPARSAGPPVKHMKPLAMENVFFFAEIPWKYHGNTMEIPWKYHGNTGFDLKPSEWRTELIVHFHAMGKLWSCPIGSEDFCVHRLRGDSCEITVFV